MKQLTTQNAMSQQLLDSKLRMNQIQTTSSEQLS